MRQSEPLLTRAIKNAPAASAVLEARRAGATLREAAARGGVHVATVCRWQKRDPVFRDALEQAQHEARWKLPPPDEPRPPVRWLSQCPLCKARVVVRTAAGKARFWRCGLWPRCPWASWRPRAPRNCRRCGGVCYWSHSRKSIACSGCGVRTFPP